MKTKKLVIISILSLIVIVCSVLCIKYIISTVRISEGLTTQTSTTNFIITLTSTNKNIDMLQNKLDVGNGIPANLEYNIMSLSSDNKIRDDTIISFKGNLSQQVDLKSVNPYTPKSEYKDMSNRNSFIIISPKSKKAFPDNFTIKLDNNIDENKTQYDLWGDSHVNALKKRPIGNANTIIGSHNLPSYINNTDDTAFTYDRLVFNDNCFKENEDCEVNQLNIGNKIVNVIQSGDILDNTGKKIGNVTKTNRLKGVSMETILINIENTSDITGILIYMGPPIPV